MNIAETDLDGYRIYAAALTPEDRNGYVAAVVVSEIRNHMLGLREVFRDEQLASGYRWADPADALSHAIEKGAEVVRRKQYRVGHWPRCIEPALAFKTWLTHKPEKNLCSATAETQAGQPPPSSPSS